MNTLCRLTNPYGSFWWRFSLAVPRFFLGARTRLLPTEKIIRKKLCRWKRAGAKLRHRGKSGSVPLGGWPVYLAKVESLE